MSADGDDFIAVGAKRLSLFLDVGSEVWALEFRDRIKKVIRVKGCELRSHPKNPRMHPESQVNVLRAAMTELGICDLLLVYKAGDGVLTVIEGDCRKTNFGETVWPCALLDVDDHEAEVLLAVLHPLGAMAEVDNAKMAELLSELEAQQPELQAQLEKFMRECGGLVDRDAGDVAFKEFDESAASEVEYNECPSCHHKWPK